MLEIVVEPRQSYSLKQAVIEAVKTGDYNSLYDDIRDCFTEHQIEEMEELLESGDIGETIDEIIAEWNGEDVDELFESIESYFSEASIEIQFIHDDDFEEEDDDSDDDDDYGYDDIAEEEEAEEGDDFVDPDEEI